MSDSYKVFGTIKKICAPVTRGSFTSVKVWLGIDEDGKYPQTIEVELSKNLVERAADLQVGDEVQATFSLRGRVWEGGESPKCFTTLSCFKLESGNQVGEDDNPVPKAKPAAVTRPETPAAKRRPTVQIED